MPSSPRVGERDCGDLGYDLGYLRHGSFGRLDWPADRGGVCWMRWLGLPAVPLRRRRAVAPSYGLDAGVMVARSTLALPMAVTGPCYSPADGAIP
jgi:hypothetical protein